MFLFIFHDKSKFSVYLSVNDSFAFGNTNLKTAALAQSGCALRGGNLVSFRSEAEMDAMITELTAASPGSTWTIGNTGVWQ